MNIRTEHYHQLVAYKQAVRKKMDLTPFKEFVADINGLKAAIDSIDNMDLVIQQKGVLYSRLLRNGITSTDQLKNMEVEELAQIHGVGDSYLNVLIKYDLIKK